MTSTKADPRVGENIAAIRERNSMSRKQLGDRAGITRQYVRKIEVGEQDPSLSIMRHIASALGVTLDELTG